MFDVGRVCVKIAGRHAGKYAVVVEVIDKNFVLIDGQMKRKRCNIFHLEPTNEMVTLKKGASHAEVVKALEKLKIVIAETKPKTKKGAKPQQQRKQKIASKENKEEKQEKKVVKKEEKKKEKQEKKHK